MNNEENKEKKESKLLNNWNTFKNHADKAGQWIKGQAENIDKKYQNNKAFKKQTETYEIIGIGVNVKAFRDIDGSSIFFKQDDKNAKHLLSKTILKNKEDGSEIQIKEVDKKTAITKEIIVEIKGKEPSFEKIQCFRATYKDYEEPTRTTTNHYQQTVTVQQGGTINGDIVQNNYTEQFNEIEKEISNYKTTLFNKKKKDEAMVLFGNFKNCIINKQKDKTMFDKFLDVLKIVAPTTISLVTNLIASI